MVHRVRLRGQGGAGAGARACTAVRAATDGERLVRFSICKDVHTARDLGRVH